MKFASRLLVFLACCSTAFAGTVRLVNDTAFKLRAVVRAADGTEIGAVDVSPQQTMSWNNYWGGVGNIQYYDASQTPYTIIWFCNLEGGDPSPFSICSGVSSGSTVVAGQCDGTRACQPPKKKQKLPPAGYNPPQPSQSPQPSAEQQMQEQNEQSEGPPQGQLQ
jgi:hypothetical protein